MVRYFLCLAFLLLAACAGTPQALRDPAYPDEPTYQAFVRQHLVLTEGKILAHFPGLLECKVEALTEGYAPEEMKMLDAYAQNRDSDDKFVAMGAERAHAAWLRSGQFLAHHPECADIRAQPGAFADGKDFVVQGFLNRNEPLFEQQSVSDDLRQASASCYWDVLRSHLSSEEQQALDGFARGGPSLASSPTSNVGHDEMKATCPDTMARLDAALTIYTYTYSRGDYLSSWPGRS